MRLTNKEASLQSVLATNLTAYRQQHTISSRQYQVCDHLVKCRTAGMGAVRLGCTDCDKTQLHFFACRDRHCPKCQHEASKQWSEKQQESLLPVTYHHVVFTLPSELNPWVSLHPEVIYKLFFQSMWSTLKRFAESPKHLGGQIGVTSVLHTWGENLSRHVHIHCLIPGGALTDAQEWVSAKGSYLFPVRALSRRIRGCMVSALRESAGQGLLDRVTEPGQIDDVLNTLMSKEWVVYSKACEGRAESVVQYLSRYSHKIAISDTRMQSVDTDGVVFTYKDYRDGDKQKTMRLSTEEFIRRFLLHVLPKGLMRIRHYGFLSNRHRRVKVEEIRKLLAAPEQYCPTTQAAADDATRQPMKSIYRCPKCRVGELLPLEGQRYKPPSGFVVH